MDTIDIDEHVKADLILDAEEYYSPESKKFYAAVGIPFRRGYLFHGPPGTGKTSFSSALAGHLKCDIYIINLTSSDMSDGKLHSLFLSLPRKCVVVIEDIDSAGIGREQEKPPEVMTPPIGGIETFQVLPLPPPPRRRPSNVTLSGLLNAIDGNASQEGRLLILTSNNPDALDEALTRPGRIDKRIHFSNLSEASARGIFERLIGRAAISSGKQTPADIKKMAALFARKLPANEFTPAQVQNFLQFCRGDADKALAELDKWVKEQLKPKKTKKTKPEMSTKEPKVNGVDLSAPPPTADTVEGMDTAASSSGLTNGATSDLAPETGGNSTEEEAGDK
jgi:chaperone BCS1